MFLTKILRLRLCQIKTKTVSEVLGYVKNNPNEFKKDLVDNYIEVKMDTSAMRANKLIKEQGVYVALVTDEKGRPTHYVTTGDIRKLLTDEESYP